MTDKDEFCRLIRTNEKAMYYLAFSLVRNDADAAEIISESIFRGYKNMESLKSTDAFKTWILRIVHNTAVETIRKNSKVIFLDEIDHLAYNNDNSLTTSISLKQAIEKLKPDYRTAIILYYYEDLSISDISKITNSSIATVKQRLSRGRKHLREILKEDYDSE